MELKDYSKTKRNEILSSNAQKRISFSYFKQLSEDELNEQKELYFEHLAVLDSEKRKLDEAKVEFKQATELPARASKEAYKIIKAKGREVEEDVYLIPNYDTQMIDYINEDGECVFSRRMLPEERQIMMKVSNE